MPFLCAVPGIGEAPFAFSRLMCYHEVSNLQGGLAVPTYLSISFEYSKQHLTDQTVRDFCDALLAGGATFAGGYWGFENDSYEEIIRWNQAKLQQNFELGCTEHHTHDYKQMLLHFGSFSEVRLFVMNERKQPFFTFELIIPEEDFFSGQDAASGKVQPERLALAEGLAVRMWEAGGMDCIQAAWESWDDPKAFAAIANGEKPCCMPFCILPRRVVLSQWRLTCRPIGREGILCRQEY